VVAVRDVSPHRAGNPADLCGQMQKDLRRIEIALCEADKANDCEKVRQHIKDDSAVPAAVREPRGAVAGRRAQLLSADEDLYSHHEEHPNPNHYMGNSDSDEGTLFGEHPTPKQTRHERRDAEPESDKYMR
jgi:hypothetical protein